MAQDSYPSSARASGVVSDVEYEALTSPFYPSGIIGTPDDLYPVYCDSSGTRGVHFRAGSLGLVRGMRYAEGSTDTTISAAANATGSDRYDLAVWRVDRSVTGSPVRAALVTGTSNPAGPAPTQNDVSNTSGKWEYPIGVVKVGNGATALAGSAVRPVGYWLALPSYITLSTGGSPAPAKGQRVYEWDTGAERTGDGANFKHELLDTGWVPVSPVSGFSNPPTGYGCQIRVKNGMVTLVCEVQFTGGGTVPAGGNTVVATFNPAYSMTSSVPLLGHANATIVQGKALNGQIVVSPAAALATGALIVFAIASWPLGSN